MILSPLKTFVLAGHSNSDPGAIANGKKEADYTKEAKRLFHSHFEDKSQIITDRDDQSLSQVLKTLKPGVGSVLVDFHFDSASPTASGTTFFVNRKDFENKNSMSYRMATEMAAFTSQTLGIKNRGVKCESDTRHGKLGVLNIGAGCAVLGELGFISNRGDTDAFDSRKDILMAGLSKIANRFDDMVK